MTANNSAEGLPISTTTPPFSCGNVLGVQVAHCTLASASEFVCDQATAGHPGYVVAAPVHNIMEAVDSTEHCRILNEASLVVPDGAPVAWALRMRGFKDQGRVAGPDLMLEVCKLSAQRKIKIGFFGSSDECLDLLKQKLPEKCPGIEIVYAYSPPFRELTDVESDAVFSQIASNGCQILFVGLGCPKQERWMGANTHRTSAMLLGVGAAFDFHAGLLERAPGWMQRSGLEWFYRLVKEPKRLWLRYLRHNPRYVWLLLLQSLGIKKYQPK